MEHRDRRFGAAFTTSLHTKFLTIVLGGVILPMGLIGLWLTRSAERSGEMLLRARLDSTLVRTEQEAGNAWIAKRSALLSIAEDPSVQAALGASTVPGAAQHRVGTTLLLDYLRRLSGAADAVTVVDRRHTRWLVDSTAAGAVVLSSASSEHADAVSSGELPIHLAVYRAGSDEIIGTIETRFHLTSLVPAASGGIGGAAGVVAIADPETRAVLAPLPIDPDLLRRPRFRWGGEEWLTASRRLDEPPMELLAAAPTSEFTVPFADAARRGLAALILVTGIAIAVAALLTRRVTRSLGDLANAADAVASGDLNQHVDAGTSDEIGRVAKAFNAMAESLRRTLGELSQRQAVAAVGEFAAALAHEIRNPLTAIRLNLQRAEEQLVESAGAKSSVANALRDIGRLEATLAGALRVARTGNMALEQLDLAGPVRSAMRSAEAEFERRHVILAPAALPAEPVLVRGNSAALEQLVLNLLLNAAQACDPGQRAGVRVERREADAVMTVWDNGRGFGSGGTERAFDPFFTTKPEGTGLGLTIARRIAAAHRGEIHIDAARGKETMIRLCLPLAGAAMGTRESAGVASDA